MSSKTNMVLLWALLVSFALSLLSDSFLHNENSSVGRMKRSTSSMIRGEGNIETTKMITSEVDQSNVEFKEIYSELKTYALLQNDFKGSLSTEFTICSTIYTTHQFDHYPLILLGRDDHIFFKTYIVNTNDALKNASSVGLAIRNIEYHKDKTLVPKVFPEQWVKSCVAFSVLSGSIKWVLDGNLILDITSETLKKAENLAPTNLTGKIILGAAKSSAGWKSSRFRMTNLNVFSSSLSLEKLEIITSQHPHKCDVKGDYLKWKDMIWKRFADIQDINVSIEKPCSREPNMTLFFTQFPKMKECMYHCEKLGGRSAGVVKQQQWDNGSCKSLWHCTGW